MHFLKHALTRAYDLRKAYYLYTQQNENFEVILNEFCFIFKINNFLILQINCADVVLFWRIQQVIKVTANALRQQIVNREARRVDKEIKEVLGKK
jgi:optic atrophy protein 1